MISSASKNRTLLLIISILLLANIALLFFFVWMKEPEKKPARTERVSAITNFLQKDIGFSDSQMKEFEQMHQDHRNKMKPLFDSMRASKDRYYRLMQDSSANNSIIETKLALIGRNQQDIDREMFIYFKSIRKLCTPDQQVKFDSSIEGYIHKMMIPFRRPSDQQKDTKTPVGK